MDQMLKDKRFAHIAKDPKFRRIPKRERKVKIDKRFRSMFEDKKFTVKYTIDKRGRPMNQSSTENLKKYYDLSSSEEEEEDAEKDKQEKKTPGSLKAKRKSKVKLAKDDSRESAEENVNESKTISCEDSKDTESEVSADENNEAAELDENERQLFVDEKNDKITKDVKKKLRDLTVDYARGEGALFSDSSSDETTSESDNDEEEEIEHAWGELDKEAETTDEITNRLALCNMDWDRIRAVDIFVLINSFLPAGGSLKSVTIYPSDFGRQRMAEEEVKGPIELVEADKKREGDEDDQNEEGSEYHLEKMRQYQLNRLKYYYAILDFDSPETANKIYTECDGIEYESTSTKLDLRFIPDDMEFDAQSAEFCDKLPEPAKYQPRQFTTTALQQVKVKLTWDDMNQSRQDILMKINSGKLDEIDENDMRTYFASGTSDEESEKGEPANVTDEESMSEPEAKKNSIEKYKSLLKSIEHDEDVKKKSKIDLELTWEIGQKEKSEKLIKERIKKEESSTPFEQYLEKRRAKKKAKREEKEKLRGKNDNDSSVVDSDDSVPSDVDMNDPYFADELKNGKVKNKKSGKSKKIERTNSSDDEEETRRKAELELLLLDKDDEEGKRHFNIKKIEEEATLSKSKKKRLMKKRKNDNETTINDDFEVDVADPRFAAIYTSHHYNIDPADPHYRKTKGTEALVTEKLKRRIDTNIKEDPPRKQIKRDGQMSTDLAALVKSVKRNTKNITKPIK